MFFFTFQFAATSPKLVNKLCLVAPASTDADMIASLGNPIHAPSSKWTQPADNYLPILLAWSKDDRALWFSNSKVWTDTLKSNQLKLITAETGGHRILPEYLEGIISFLTK
jgi:pimeloyl-ACP methyl ester carboxylesterase